MSKCYIIVDIKKINDDITNISIQDTPIIFLHKQDAIQYCMDWNTKNNDKKKDFIEEELYESYDLNNNKNLNSSNDNNKKLEDPASFGGSRIKRFGGGLI